MLTTELAEQVIRRVVARLKAARDEKGLSLRDLERLSGLSDGGIHQIESGKINSPTLFALLRMADALELDFGQVVNDAQAGAELDDHQS